MSESESISVLQKWTNSWVIGKTEWVWDGGASDEDLDVVHAALRAVQAALEAANERAERKWKVINSEADLPSEAGWYVVRYNGDWTDAIAHFDPLHHQWWNERPIKAYIPEPIPEFKEVTVK